MCVDHSSCSMDASIDNVDVTPHGELNLDASAPKTHTDAKKACLV